MLRSECRKLALENSCIYWLAVVPQSKRGSILLRDIQHILGEVEWRIEDLYRIESRFSTYRMLLASEQSREQANRLGRLTTLAFFFIPLSFVTSFFGMNITEFGTGTDLWVYIVSSVGLMVVVIFLWFTSRFIAKYLSLFRRNWGGMRARGRCITRFTRYSLVGAFWLFVFAITHSPLHTRLMTNELGIDDILRLHHPWTVPQYGTNRSVTRGTEMLSSFWEKRMNAIHEITRHPDWMHSNMFSRRTEAKNTGNASTA